MLDKFDLALLDLVQRDDGLTAEAMAQIVPLSPSALARRLRRLRHDGWIERTVALLSPRLTNRRLRALVTLQLADHADQPGKNALLERVQAAEQVQFCLELAGTVDFLLLLDCGDLDEFNELVARLLECDAIVQRYETSFVKRTAKFAPFIRLLPPETTLSTD